MISIRFLLLILVMGCLCSCSSSLPVSLQKIDDHRVEFMPGRKGGPIVVFETIQGPTMNTWKAVFHQVSAFTGVYAYNTPDYGISSNRFPPRSDTAISERFRTNLRKTGCFPPYILVGHSAGGLYFTMFARLCSDEVMGVLLFNSKYPDQFQYFIEEKDFLYAMLIDSFSRCKRSYEASVIKEVHREFNEARPFPDIPLVVLTSINQSTLFEWKKMRAKWIEFQTDFATMSTKSNHYILEGSGHYIPKDNPVKVISVIEHMVV